MENSAKTIWINLGYIGKKAEVLRKLYEGYEETPNEHGFYLKFEDFSDLVVNEGVTVETNCFKSKKAFKKDLYNRLLMNL